MKKPALFFDRDNTLLVCDKYLGDPAAVTLVRGAADAVARARAMGYCVVTISNQSGVARGFFTEEAVLAVNRRMDELLQMERPGAIIDRHEFCPFHPQAQLEAYRQESDLRKPRPGMFHRAAREMNLDLTASWLVGDTPRDVEAGHAAGCKTILIRDPTLAPSPEASETSRIAPDATVSSLAEAMDLIESGGPAPQEDPTAQLASEIDLTQQKLSKGEMTLEAQPPSAAPPQDGTIDPPPPPVNLARLEHLVQQIADQLRRRHEHPMDFSVGKLLAGVTQTLAIALAVANYFYRPDGAPTLPLMAAIFLQTMTISLLMMGRE